MKLRVSAIVIKGDQILIIRRVKPEIEYYVLPGGTVEEGEKIEDSLVREVKEELSLDVKASKLLFEIDSDNRKDYYFLISEWSGDVKLGGPEAEERMSNENQYHLEWINKDQFKELENFFPDAGNAKDKILSIWDKQ